MTRSMEAIDHTLEKEEGELDWLRHVKPFGERFVDALRALGDWKSVEMVLGWQKRVRRRLMAVAQWRYLERQRFRVEHDAVWKEVKSEARLERARAQARERQDVDTTKSVDKCTDPSGPSISGPKS